MEEALWKMRFAHFPHNKIHQASRGREQAIVMEIRQPLNLGKIYRMIENLTKKNLAPARGATTFMIIILCCSSSLRVPGQIYVKRQVLGFQFAADDQQLEELKVAHYLNAIATAALIPLAKP